MFVKIKFIDGSMKEFECESTVHCDNGMEKINICTEEGKLNMIAFPIHAIMAIQYIDDYGRVLI